MSPPEKPVNTTTPGGPLNARQRRHLRALAHALHPLVRVGQRGLSEAVLAELDIALLQHELVKIKVTGADRDARAAMIARACSHSGAELVQTIGQVAVLFRRNPKAEVVQFPAARTRGA